MNNDPPEKSRSVMDQTPRISVIVPVYNGMPHLATAIEALIRQDSPEPYEIIFVDNNSSDASRELISRYVMEAPSRLFLVDAFEKQGQVYARNKGVNAARGDILVFTDQDDISEPNWLLEITKAIESASAVGGFVQYTWPGQNPTPGTGAAAAALPCFFDRFPVAFGNNFAIRRAVLESIGGWQDIGVFAGEDVDLCARLLLAGYDLAYAPRARVTWRARGDMRGCFKQGFSYGCADVRLFKKYKNAGAKRRKIIQVARSWKQALAGMSRKLFMRTSILAEVHSLGWLLGRLVESFRNGELYL